MTEPTVPLREHIEILIAALRQEVRQAQDASQEAIRKAEAATERRFEGVNEFRATLTDQAAQFATRDRLEAVDAKFYLLAERNRNDIDALAKRIDVREGQDVGSKLTTATLVTVVTVSVGVLGLLILLANFATGH